MRKIEKEKIFYITVLNFEMVSTKLRLSQLLKNYINVLSKAARWNYCIANMRVHRSYGSYEEILQ